MAKMAKTNQVASGKGRTHTLRGFGLVQLELLVAIKSVILLIYCAYKVFSPGK